MPTNRQRRQAQRRHQVRQWQRRQQRDAVRRRNTLIATIFGTLVVIAAIVLAVVFVGGHGKSSPAASGSATAGASSTASPSPSTVVTTQVSTISQTTGACGYTGADLKDNPDLKNTGYPPDPKVTPTLNRVVTFNTNRGVIKLTLNGALAPCNVQSIAYLVGKKFYDNTSCPRLVTTGIFVLQCGDPSATGSGGPSYTTKDENLTKAKYVKGVVAMANSGADTNGSQFFIIYKDLTPGSLGASYTEIGTITSGMDIIEQVAAGGDDGSNSAGGGKPKVPLDFTTVTVAPPVVGSATPVSRPTTTVETITPSAAAS